MTAPYKLYGRPGSGSIAVQVALEETGAPYELIWVGREAADVARFRATNPTGRVPALVLPDGTPLFESAAMLIHLALISHGLGPYVLGSEYSIADAYLYMLASWYPGERSQLYARAPKLEAHAKLTAARPAVAKAEADHAQ